MWCEEKNVHLDCLGFIKNDKIKRTGEPMPKYPKRVRCPKCKHRFETFVRYCDDEYCLHLYMPKHKVKVKKKKLPSKDNRGKIR